MDLVSGRYYGKGAFRASINPNANFISGRNITRIFSLAHVQCKKDNGDILGNTFMAPIGGRINNSCAGKILGWSHEGKTQFRILTHGCPLLPPRAKYIFNSVWPRFFVTEDLDFCAIVLGKGGISPHWFFECMLAPFKWRDQGHLMVTKCNLEGLKFMYKTIIYISEGGFTQSIGFRSMAMW